MKKFILIFVISFLSVEIEVFAQGNTILVYPGDVNNDGIVNGFDYLSIGFKANLFGQRRINSSASFQPQQAFIWLDDSTNVGENAAYADCNGDGIVANNDVELIDFNLGLMRANAQPTSFSQFNTNAVPLYFEGIPSLAEANDTFQFEIHLGNDNFPVQNFHGIAFSIDYDTTKVKLYIDSFNDLILPNSPKIHSNIGFVQPNKNNIYYSFFESATPTNISSYVGKISAMIKGRAIFEENVGLYIRPETPIVIDIKDIYLANSTSTILPIYNQQQKIYILNKAPSIYPNPVSDILYLNNINCSEYSIFDIHGKFHFSSYLNKTDYIKSIDLNQLPQGLFIIKMKVNDHYLYHKIIKK